MFLKSINVAMWCAMVVASQNNTVHAPLQCSFFHSQFLHAFVYNLLNFGPELFLCQAMCIVLGNIVVATTKVVPLTWRLHIAWIMNDELVFRQHLALVDAIAIGTAQARQVGNLLLRALIATIARSTHKVEHAVDVK